MAALWLLPAAHAADLILAPGPLAEQAVDLGLPAVSGINGKLELDIGAISDPSDTVFRLGGSLSLPLGERFGLQGDFAVQSIGGDLMGGGALHAFMRDPSFYLIGITAGIVAAEGVSLSAIGPEAELYLDRISLEGWAGFAALSYEDSMLTDDDGFFAIGDIAFYATDNWRLSLGAASILGEGSLRLATEYQFGDFGLPLSGVGELRFSEDSTSIRVGLKGYFGDPGKSLIDRHRQDDPPNRVLDLFGAAGNLLTAEAEERGRIEIDERPRSSERWRRIWSLQEETMPWPGHGLSHHHSRLIRPLALAMLRSLLPSGEKVARQRRMRRGRPRNAGSLRR